MKRTPPAINFILDANVLIDYCKSDKSILALVSKCVGVIHLASPVLDEVKQLSLDELSDLSIDLAEPELDQLLTARSRRGPLSFQDHLCLLMAAANTWTCVTNDSKLRRECETQGIETMWGLEPLALLTDARQISREAALDVAKKIQESNPRFITKEIIKRFRTRISLRLGEK